MKLYEVSAFTRNNQGGNLAGVALLDEELTNKQMQEIAYKLKYSETAFIKQTSSNEFNINFFTVETQVDLCGHATIASFALLKEKGIFKENHAIQTTKAGILKVLCDDYILMEMSQAKLHQDCSIEECAKVLNLNIDEIIMKPSIVEVGLKDCMVLVKDLDTLNKIKYNRDLMIEYSKKLDITGYHVATIQDGKYYVRNFAPACGIDEESATGTSNASMYYYLLKNNLINKEQSIEFLQGDIMNQPSTIVVSMKDNTIWVGGSSKIIKEIV